MKPKTVALCNMIKRSFRQTVAEQALEDTIAKQHTRVSLVAQMVKSNTHTHTQMMNFNVIKIYR